MPEHEVLSISEFKATCLAVLDRVKRTGQSILITRRGEPVAMIDPPPKLEPEASWIGSFSSTGTIHGDIVQPASESADWEVLHE